MGGGAPTACNNLTVNGQRVNWEEHYNEVDHSFKVWSPGIHRYVYCQDPAYNDYTCLASVEGMVFTLLGAGGAARAVISLAGGGSLGAVAIWDAC
ncbi:hypothetical protein GCM10020000_77680 [Streptomyces olivoverticillatus]